MKIQIYLVTVLAQAGPKWEPKSSALFRPRTKLKYDVSTDVFDLLEKHNSEGRTPPPSVHDSIWKGVHNYSFTTSGSKRIQRLGRKKMRNACGTALKYVLFFSNLVIWIGGLVAIGMSTWILVNNASVGNFIGTNLLSSAMYILLVTGLIASLVALFGCIGAIKEIKFILVIYFILLFIIFTVMLAGGILGYIFIETVENTMETEMYNTLKYYGRNTEVTNNWNYVQSTFHCCGVNNYKDWLKLGNIPESCRVKPNTHPFITSEYYSSGCLKASIAYVQKHSALIGGSGITIACLMLLGMLFSWTLYMIIE